MVSAHFERVRIDLQGLHLALNLLNDRIEVRLIICRWATGQMTPLAHYPTYEAHMIALGIRYISRPLITLVSHPLVLLVEERSPVMLFKHLRLLVDLRFERAFLEGLVKCLSLFLRGDLDARACTSV